MASPSSDKRGAGYLETVIKGRKLFTLFIEAMKDRCNEEERNRLEIQPCSCLQVIAYTYSPYMLETMMWD